MCAHLQTVESLSSSRSSSVSCRGCSVRDSAVRENAKAGSPPKQAFFAHDCERRQQSQSPDPSSRCSRVSHRWFQPRLVVTEYLIRFPVFLTTSNFRIKFTRPTQIQIEVLLDLFLRHRTDSYFIHFNAL